MEFIIYSKNNKLYRFKIMKNENNNANFQVLYVKNEYEYSVDKIIVTDSVFSVILNSIEEDQTFFFIKDSLYNIPFKNIIIEKNCRCILEERDILISSNTKNFTKSRKNIYKMNLEEELLDETRFVRTLIDIVASTRLAEIAIVLNNCQKQFYDILQGDKILKEKYLLFINYYNSSELTQKYDSQTKAGHYLLTAYVFMFYKNYGKENNKLDKLFELNLEKILNFYNNNLENNKEQLLFAVQNEFDNKARILNLVPYSKLKKDF